MSTVVSIVMNLLAMACLARAWRLRKQQKLWPLRVAGGLLCAMALLGWWHVAGLEFGTVYWFGFTALSAWSCVLIMAEYGESNDKTKPYRLQRWKRRQWLRGLGMALAICPLAMIVSIVASLVLVALQPGEIADRWVLAAILQPVIWALVSLWIVSTNHLRLVSFGCATATIFASVSLYAFR